MDVKVKIDLTEKEYMRFGFYCQRKFMIWVPLTVAVICFLAFILIDIALSKKSDFVVLCVLAVIAGVSTHFIGSRIAFLRIRSVWKSSAPLMGLADTTFSDGGIYQVSDVGTLNLSYDKFFKVCETQMAFYAYVSSTQAVIVPKRCFESAEDVKTVRELFIKNVDKKKLRLRDEKGV